MVDSTTSASPAGSESVAAATTGAPEPALVPTPVPDAKVRPRRIPADVVNYNAAARRVMQKYSVPIHDLYSFALVRLEKVQLPANVHFTTEGSVALAEEVAKVILDGLK